MQDKEELWGIVIGERTEAAVSLWWPAAPFVGRAEIVKVTRCDNPWARSNAGLLTATRRVLIPDGVVRIDVDGERTAEYGPGSLHGERAVLEDGVRTSTIRAVKACSLAVVSGTEIGRAVLAEFKTGHRRGEFR